MLVAWKKKYLFRKARYNMSVSDRLLIAANREKHKAACRELRKHLPSFLIVGEQLMIIRDAGVWQETHKTLEAFINDEFGLEKSRAYQLISAATVKANLFNLSTNCGLELPILPSNEGQFRELAKAPAEQQAEVVRKAAEKAAEENRKPTAKDYQQAVKQVVGELLSEPEEEPAAKPDPVPEPSHHPKEMAGPLMAHVKTLVQMLNDLKKRAAERGGEWIDVQAISMQVSALKYSLKSSIYYADCPACGGKRCERCKQTGFLPELKSAVVDEAK